MIFVQSQRLERPRGTPDCPLECTRFVTERVMHKFTLYHWHPEVEIFYILRGSYEMYSPQGCQTVKEGELYLVTPGEDHAIRALERKGTYWSVGFALSMVAGTPNSFLQSQFVLPLQSGKLQLPRNLISGHPVYETVRSQIETLIAMEDKTQSFKLTAHVAANMICAALFPYCIAVTGPAKGCSREHDAAKTCVQYIHDHYSKQITVEQLAQLVHLHPNYLCGVFKKHIGMTIVAYLKLYRVRQARKLLSDINLSLQQVAERTGFNSVSYFSRVFKEEMGISPGAFGQAYEKSTNKFR